MLNPSNPLWLVLWLKVWFTLEDASCVLEKNDCFTIVKCSRDICYISLVFSIIQMFYFLWFSMFSSVQFSSVVANSLWRMNRSKPGLPVHHQLLEFTQTHVHCVGDAIQPPYPLSSPSPPALNLSQHQGLFQWISSLHQVARVLEISFQHQSFQWIFRVDFL